MDAESEKACDEKSTLDASDTKNVTSPYLAYGSFKRDPTAEGRRMKVESEEKKIKVESYGNHVKFEGSDDEDKKPHLKFGKFKPDPEAPKCEEKIKIDQVVILQKVPDQDVSKNSFAQPAGDENTGTEDVGMSEVDFQTPQPEIAEERHVSTPPVAELQEDDPQDAGAVAGEAAIQPQVDEVQRSSSSPRLVSQEPDARSTNQTEQRKQPKRRRTVLDAVVLPTLQEVRRKALMTREEEVKKIEKMKNDNVTMKKRELCFNVDTIRDRLRPVGLDLFPITLDNSIRDVMVTRQFMSTVYGGGQQCCFAGISKTKRRQNNHDYDSFMFLSLELNCHAPEIPGSPGMYFNAGGSGYASPIEETQRLFTRIAKTHQGTMWQYQGQYKLEPSHPLTTKEWASVHYSVRTNWAKEIYKSAAWGKSTRVSIALRKALGRPCTNEEFLEAFTYDRSFEEITVDEIGQALLQGHERVAVWTMKCVGYDEDFQRDLAAKFGVWTPPPPKTKEGGKGSKTSKKAVKKELGDRGDTKKGSKSGGAGKAKAGQKRKRSEDSESESEEADEEEEAWEDDSVEEPFEYQPSLGTHSRPIIVV